MGRTPPGPAVPGAGGVSCPADLGAPRSGPADRLHPVAPRREAPVVLPEPQLDRVDVPQVGLGDERLQVVVADRHGQPAALVVPGEVERAPAVAVGGVGAVGREQLHGRRQAASSGPVGQATVQRDRRGAVRHGHHPPLAAAGDRLAPDVLAALVQHLPSARRAANGDLERVVRKRPVVPDLPSSGPDRGSRGETEQGECEAPAGACSNIGLRHGGSPSAVLTRSPAGRVLCPAGT